MMTAPDHSPLPKPQKGGASRVRSADNIGAVALSLLPYYFNPLVYLIEIAMFMRAGEGAVQR